MIPEEQNNETPQVSQADFRELMAEKMKAAVRLTLMAILETELEEYIGAGRYERSEQRRDHRIGHRTRDLGTSIGVIEDLAVPRTRQGFQTQVFEKYQRRQAELDQAIGGMFVKGMSTTQVGEVLEKHPLRGVFLNEVKASPSTHPLAQPLRGPRGLRGPLSKGCSCRGCFTNWKRSMQPGSSGSCPAATCMGLRMGRISAPRDVPRDLR